MMKHKCNSFDSSSQSWRTVAERIDPSSQPWRTIAERIDPRLPLDQQAYVFCLCCYFMPNLSICTRNLLSFILFWYAPLRVRRVKRRHQSPEWAILSQVDCFVQEEVK